MRSLVLRIALFAGFVLFAAPGAFAEECISCHIETTPSIVSDWQLSAHADNFVGCADCHGPDHMSPNDLEEVQIPSTCCRCR